MNNSFWNGFEKRASLIQSAIKGTQNLGKTLSGWGGNLTKATGRQKPGWFKGNLGEGLKGTGEWISANPRKALAGAGMAAAGGAGYMLGNRNQNVNVYR